MKTNKFTPGPWHAIETNIETSNGTLYAPDIRTARSFPDLRPNAALIAAAPEMYSEIETLIGCLEVGTETPEDLEVILKYSKSILAKVRGESLVATNARTILKEKLNKIKSRGTNENT